MEADRWAADAVWDEAWAVVADEVWDAAWDEAWAAVADKAGAAGSRISDKQDC